MIPSWCLWLMSYADYFSFESIRSRRHSTCLLEIRRCLPSVVRCRARRNFYSLRTDPPHYGWKMKHHSESQHLLMPPHQNMMYVFANSLFLWFYLNFGVIFWEIGSPQPVFMGSIDVSRGTRFTRITKFPCKFSQAALLTKFHVRFNTQTWCPIDLLKVPVSFTRTPLSTVEKTL